MSPSNQQVLVIVNGREYRVELQDVYATPVIAVVEGQRFEVYFKEEESGREQGSVREVSSQPERTNSLEPTGDSAGFYGNDKFGNSRVRAPLPGDIAEVFVQPGQDVETGDPLCVLDAMKMKNIIHAPHAGRIASVDVHRGQSVDHGDSLVTYE